MVSFTYPLDFPDLDIVAIRHSPRSAVTASRSPFSYAGDVQVYAGQRRVWRVELAPLTRESEQAALEGFLMRLNGREGTFLLGDPVRGAPRGAYDAGSDTPLLDSSGSPAGNQARDRVLVTDGWRNSGTGLLLQGDMIQLGSGATASLHTVLSDVDSDGTGAAEIDIWPGLRRTPNDNEALTLSAPKGLWKLVEAPDYDADPGVYGVTLDIEEWF